MYAVTNWPLTFSPFSQRRWLSDVTLAAFTTTSGWLAVPPLGKGLFSDELSWLKDSPCISGTFQGDSNAIANQLSRACHILLTESTSISFKICLINDWVRTWYVCNQIQHKLASIIVSHVPNPSESGHRHDWLGLWAFAYILLTNSSWFFTHVCWLILISPNSNLSSAVSPPRLLPRRTSSSPSLCFPT